MPAPTPTVADRIETLEKALVEHALTLLGATNAPKMWRRSPNLKALVEQHTGETIDLT
jgi:hypothetical protein